VNQPDCRHDVSVPILERAVVHSMLKSATVQQSQRQVRGDAQRAGDARASPPKPDYVAQTGHILRVLSYTNVF
jgi:hypothetical protein